MVSSEGASGTALPGTVLAGKYQVERTLGQGGMGVVVAARHLHLGTRVALKFLLPSVLGSPDLVARFLREAQTASLIASDHVTRVLDVGTLPDGAPFIVMEYLDGRDLSSLLREKGPLPITDAVDYTLQACEALAVAHAAGVVHRDLKPANLFLTEQPDGSPHIKILDFGISKKQGLEGEFALTRTDAAIMGSPAYISPEQIRSQRKVDGRADIWSLGASLYELLTGQIPFTAENLGGLIAAILSEPPEPLRASRPDVPPGLEAAVLACLEKSLAARTPDAAALAQQLRPFASPRGAASVERTLGVFARTTGGSPAAARAPAPAASPAEPVAASNPIPAAPTLTSTRPMTAPAPQQEARASQPMSPAVPATTGGPPQAPWPVAHTQTAGAWGTSGTDVLPPRRSRGLWIGLGAAFLAVVGVGLFALRSTEEPSAASTGTASAGAVAETAAPPPAPTVAPEPSAAAAPGTAAPAATPPEAPSVAPSASDAPSAASAPSPASKPPSVARPGAAAKPKASGAPTSDLNKLIQNRK